jgi:multiple sugar transport system substrate-binding protein
MFTRPSAPAFRSATPALRRWGSALLFAALALPSLCAASSDLVIDYVVSNSPQRSTWIAIVDQFAAANPDVHVVHRGFPQEQYKREFTTRLRSGGSDLAFWYAGVCATRPRPGCSLRSIPRWKHY